MALTDVLSAEHYEEVIVSSAVDPEVAAERGYRTLTGTQADRDELGELGYPPHLRERDDAYPGLLIPMHGAMGDVRGHQFKPRVPRFKTNADQTKTYPVKYETPRGASLVVDIPARTRALLESPGTALWITEGVKKVDSLVSRGIAAVGLTGVWNWRSSMGALGDWEDVPIKGRPVVVCFDADANGNRHVQLAMGRLGAWLRSRGASVVHYLIVPAAVGETPVKGVDDFFAAGGSLETLRDAATQTAPGAGEKDAAFTDAFLVEEVASEALEGKFCWAAGLGWLRWDGRVWKEAPDVEPLEVIRKWAAGRFDAVLSAQRAEPSKNLASQIAGWRAVLGKSRLSALRDLARGVEGVQRGAEEFDGDPDLLTVRNGTLHLPTLRLLPFDPAHCITKCADAEYRAGYRHPLWTKALEAVPEDLRVWFADRLGQGLTGYPTPDHVMVIGYGTGSNGKSTVSDVVRRTLADYGVLISDRVLMASPDAHPTELMDLRGARYAVMEETPEARHLNVQRLKTVVATPSIKARRIRQDPVEFLASHSLFINTNYRPVVTETDWGTWRRLALMPYPYTFRKPGKPLEGPLDRPGDPALAYAANDADVRAAALTWMAEGAHAFYARGKMMLPLPEMVESETREWRRETDLVLGFADECLRFDREVFTATRDMLAAFNEWAGERGHRPWNDRTFASRFANHDVVAGAKVKQGRFSIGGRQQRGWSGVEVKKDGDGGDPFDGGTLPEPPATLATTLPEARENTQGSVSSSPAPQLPRSPLVLGFDIETASADVLFNGAHEGPYVRLAGVTWSDPEDPRESMTEPHDHTPNAPFRRTLEVLNDADVIYGHGILDFDLIALARHCGADYDALAAKAIDTKVLSQLAEPPAAKGAGRVSHRLDDVAKRLGHTGKSDDLKRLAAKHGGFDKIPVDDPEYRDYLRGDLEATKYVYESFEADVTGKVGGAYARREMRVVAIQNRMTLNGWLVGEPLLAERVEGEAQRVAQAVEKLAGYGVPLARPDRYKLKTKKDWPEEFVTMRRRELVSEYQHTDACDTYQDDSGFACTCPVRMYWRDRQGFSASVIRRYTRLFGAAAAERGLADLIPGEPYDAPWGSDAGRAAIIAAFADAGAPHYPKTKTGALALSADALGDGTWFDKAEGKAKPGMLKVYGHLPKVREIVETLNTATGATSKYAEIQRYVTPEGRVHARTGAPQASGRWATTEPASANLGKRGEKVEQRRVFVADPGHVLITCDLAQVDVRSLAGHSQDPVLIEMLQPGRDYHSDMAELFSGDRGKRKEFKPVAHGLNYNQSTRAIAEQHGLNWSFVDQAAATHAERLSVLAERKLEWIEQARSGALLDNGFGRLMRCDPERAWTQAPALIGQGGARDIMTESLLRLVKARPDVTPYLRGVVHDEVIISVPENEAEEWRAALTSAFTWEWRGVPILCDVSRPGKSWADCVD
jgi:P4 family phage/plasmid primase-like protien